MRISLILLFAFTTMFACLTKTVKAQTTLIPDPNFEQALIDLGLDTPPINGSVITANISGITFLNIMNKNINNLTGIQDFISLTTLLCSYNNLTSLDLTHNIALTILSCNENSLTSLDVTQNTALTFLACDVNQLTSLDVTLNTALTYLNCRSNQLTALDVTHNTALTSLGCDANQLTSLDVTLNIALTSLTCQINNLTSLDVTKNIALTSLTCQINNLTSLDVTKNIALVYLFSNNNQLQSLDVTKNIALTGLGCAFNQLTNLDVTKNINLTALGCGSNNLTSLDVTKNIALANLLNCSNNQLTSLDMTKNIALLYFDCSSNHLLNLNLRSGYNSILTTMKAVNNPNLICIQVDNAVTSAGYSGWIKDPTAHYDDYCIPTIISFTPTSGCTGQVVTINGANLNVATGVTFGGVAAASYTILSATSITAIVGAGASGNINVITPGGTATLGGFTFIQPMTASVSISSTSSTICVGGSVTFTATPTNGGPLASYQWQVNGGNVGANSTTYTTNNLVNGDVVKVIMTSSLSCAIGSPATSNSITMIVLPPGPASVNISTSSTTICSGTSATFTAVPTNGGSSPAYQWQISGTNVGTNSSTYTTSSLSNGDVVQVIMTSNLSCATGSPATSNLITISVTQSLAPSVNIAASSTIICASGSVTFTATPTNGGAGAGYQWQVNGINVGANNPVYTSNTLTNGDLVTCILTSNYVCVTATTANSNTIQMTVNAPVIPSVSISASATTVCIGALVTFTATPVNGGTTPLYQWKLNGVNVGLNSPTYSTNSIVNGDIISCILSNLNSCSAVTTANSNNIAMIVTTTVVPTLTITSTVNNICPTTPVTFTAIPASVGTTPSFQWQLNGINVGGNNLTYSNNSFTNGDKINCIMNTITSCTSTPFVYSDTITMDVKPIPVISFNPSNPTISLGSSVQLNATVTGSLASYLWTPSTGLNNPTILNPLANPVTTTIYNLNVIATNSCSADKKLTVTVFKDIYIPNSFTPNGDTKNDIFRIPPGTSLNLQYFIIYDRYGNEIFKTRDINTGWDGTNKGAKSPNGTYTYLIKGSDSKVEIFLNGTILVIR